MIHPILWAAVISAMAAQLYKVVVESLRERRLKLYRLFETGGMPSSHTATVSALAVGACRAEGLASPLFAICFVFGLYFVLEATGLRQEVGKQARVLNEIIDELIDHRHFPRERTRELLGHTWSEVFMGAILGAAVSLLMVRRSG
ncbi:MAG: divergent PAP2 family protein [Candidatus Krumholzibacteriota bacterium]|nr:divergent PAP2 family protein [Candidatus Krumholzibacteriota bacterium]